MTPTALLAQFGDPRVAIVSNVVSARGERTLGSALDNLHFGTFIAGAVCCAEAIARHPCVIGKSMMLRRPALAAIGGWQAVGGVLGEDYLLGVGLSRAGYRVALSPHVIDTINGDSTLRDFLARHTRWNQMRRWIAPGLFLLEPLTVPTPWIAALCVIDPAASTLSLAALGMALRSLSDALVLRRLRGCWPAPRLLALAPLKDAAALGMWTAAWLTRTVCWRGNRFRIHRGSALTPAPIRTLADATRPAA